MDQTVQKTVETPQQQCIDKVVEDLVVHVPQVQIVGKTDEIPEIRTDVGSQTFESLGTAPVCQSTQAEIVEAVEIEVPLPAEYASLMSVTEPVLEVPPVVVEYIQVEVPQVQYIDKAVDVPVAVQRQVPGIETVQKTVEVPQTQHIDKVADVPVARPRQTLSVQRVQKTVEVPQIQFIDKLVDSHVNMRSVPEVEHVVPTPVTEHMASAPAQSHADVSAVAKSDITWTKEPGRNPSDGRVLGAP